MPLNEGVNFVDAHGNKVVAHSLCARVPAALEIGDSQSLFVAGSLSSRKW